MNSRALLGAGIAGSVVAAVCCFTPVLVIGLGAVGLTAWLAWADMVLLPALVIFAGLAVFGLIQVTKSRKAETVPVQEDES
jgi:mercuric ion transport protein